MRSERKKGRAFLARFMVLMMIINLLSGINSGVVRAADEDYYRNSNEMQDNGVTISKKVKKYNATDGGTYDIELKVKGGTKVVQNNIPLDVVLVMDTSGSMKGSALTNAKNAANNFVDKLLPKNKYVKIGIVSFADKGEIKSNLTTDVTALKNAINGLEASGGTYTQQGLEKAAGILNNAPANHKKVMVVVGDGEPTLANGKHPDFGEKEKPFKRIYSPNEKEQGYQQWHGNQSIWIGRGYNSQYRNYNVWVRNGEFGNGTKKSEGTGHISWPYNLMDKEFEEATLEAAKTIKDKADIITVGIGLENNNLAKSIMNKLATSGYYLESGAVADKIDKILDDLAEKLQKKVSEGVITDPMSEFVDCFASSVELLGTVGKAKPEISYKSITVRNITLGEGEELILRYKVKLKDEWKDGEFHPANGKTTLLPTKNGKEMEFKVPYIRSDKTKTSITVSKTWLGAPTVESVEFEVFANRKTTGKKITVSASESWTATLDNLARYEDGKDIVYTLKETKSDNYVVENASTDGMLRGTQDKGTGNWEFNITNKNTETVSVKVDKSWVNAPKGFDGEVEVALYSGDENSQKPYKVDGKALTQTTDNRTTTFTGLPKYDGKDEVVYTVREVGEDSGVLTKKVGDETAKFDVNYKKNDGNSSWVITNTFNKDNSNIEFPVTLTKIWKGYKGETAESAIFNITDGKDYSESVTLNKENAQDKTPTTEADTTIWVNDTIKLPKYDVEGKEITYTVTEEDVRGFNVDKTNGVEVNPDKPEATFTNTRTIKPITVTKIWNKTNDKWKDTIKVLLIGKVKGNEIVKEEAEITVDKQEAKFRVPETDVNGTAIEYEVKEDGEKDLQTKIKEKVFNVVYDQKNFTITNTFDGLDKEHINITINKRWEGGEGKQAKFVVKKGNDIVTKVILPKKGKWTDTVVVDKWDSNTLDYAHYTVEEVELSKAFTSVSSLRGDSIFEKENNEVTFTNTRKTGKLILTKKWVGKIGKEAEFTITPAIPGTENGKITLKGEELQNSSDWVKKYDNVPVYDVDGNAITYKITEKEQKGYKTEGEKAFSLEGTSQTAEVTFTNTSVAANTYTITKVWEAGKIPENVSFGLFDEKGTRISNLHLDDKTVNTIVLTAEDKSEVHNNVTWQKTFTTDELPTNVNYTVKELKVTSDGEMPVKDIIELDGRTYKVASNNLGNNYTFTNTDITTGTVEVTKVWNGTKVEGAKFALFKAGEEEPVSTKFIVDGNKVKFTKVPFTDNDHNDIENTYSIKELDGNDNVLADKAVFKLGERKYEVSYSQDGKTITNTELIDITVKKEWADNVPMSERKSVQVEVFDKNNFGINEIILDGGGDGNTWESTLEELPAADGPYTVEEVAINDIDVKEINQLFKTEIIKDDSVTGKITFTITNSFNITPPKDDNIKVVKNWGAYTDSKPIKVRVYKKTTDGKWMIASEETSMSGQDAVWEEEITPFAEPTKPLIEDATNNENTSNVPAQVVPSAKDEQTEMALPKEPTVPAANTNSEVNDTQVTGQSLEGDEPTGVINESEPQLREVADPLKDYYVVETAVGDKELTNDEIESILNSMTGANKEGKYKIDNYDVHVQHLDNHVAFIKNTTDNKLTEITVNKNWENTPERYQKPVKVQLYTEDVSGNLTLLKAARTLSKANKWTTKFKGLSRYASDGITDIKYHIAETAVDNESYNGTMDANVIKSGYQIGEYKVKIDGDGTEAVTITNDINKTDISVRKAWASGTTQTPVVLSLYAKKGSDFNNTGTTVTLDTKNKWVYTFEGLDKFMEDGTQILYYVFETKVGNSSYDAVTDKTTAYEIPVGTSGKYNVTVTDNGVNENTAEKPIVITNSYTANPNPGGGGNPGGGTGGGDNPGGSNPGTEPVVPVPDPTPVPTPDTTPTVDVPDDTTPQGDANINPDTDNDAEDTDDADDDDVLEVDNDDVPQGTAKTKDDAVKEDPIDVDGDSTPRGNANLPKTGGAASDFLSLIGMGLIGLGLVVRKRK